MHVPPFPAQGEVKMRVKREQIVKGVVDYIENDVIPQMKEDRAMQIILDVVAKSALGNTKLTNAVFDNNTVKAFLKCNEDGTYEIEDVFDSLSESIKKFGAFPVVIPPVPLISPTEKTLEFGEDDIAEIKRRIERSAYNG